jgi:hypothetical protein
MVLCGITKRFPVKLQQLFYEPQTLENLLNPHVIYTLLAVVFKMAENYHNYILYKISHENMS